MKKIIPFLLALVATVFTACSSDDDNNENDFNRNEKI